MAQELSLNLTDNAVRRVQELIAQEGKDNLMLRLSVSGGGCSGFQYGIKLDDSRNDDDVTLAQSGLQLVVDEASLPLLDGVVIDFVEDLMGASFQFKNPNASSTCGCGTSFAI